MPGVSEGTEQEEPQPGLRDWPNDSANTVLDTDYASGPGLSLDGQMQSSIEPLSDKVLDLVLKKIKTDHTPGNPLDSSTTMGALVDQKAVDRVKKYFEIGKSEGAKLVTGGHAPELTCPMSEGFFWSPTIFADVKQSMRIAQEEIFGPVMSVLKWTDEDILWSDVNPLNTD